MTDWKMADEVYNQYSSIFPCLTDIKRKRLQHNTNREVIIKQ